MIWALAKDGNLINLTRCDILFDENAVFVVDGLTKSHVLAECRSQSEARQLIHALAEVISAFGNANYTMVVINVDRLREKMVSV